jgi:hypothetical protein
VLVEVDGEKPARLIFKQWVHADDIGPPQVTQNDLVRNRKKRLMRTLATLDARLLADTVSPLVRTRRGIALPAGTRVHPQPWINIQATAKQGTEERKLLGGRYWRLRGLGADDFACHHQLRLERGSLLPELVEL